MKTRKYFIYLLFFIGQFLYAQNNNRIDTLWEAILDKLAVPNDLCFDSLESALHNTASIQIMVSKHENKYDNSLKDFRYVLSFDSYQMILYKSETADKYFITEIEIDFTENQVIKSLFPFNNIDDFKEAYEFGDLVNNLSSNDMLVYEVYPEWDYIYLYFINNILYKIALVSRLE